MRLPVLLGSLLLAAAPARAAVRAVELPSGPVAPLAKAALPMTPSTALAPPAAPVFAASSPGILEAAMRRPEISATGGSAAPALEISVTQPKSIPPPAYDVVSKRPQAPAASPAAPSDGGRLFDGSAARRPGLADAPRGAPFKRATGETEREELNRLARPFRTEAQLDKLNAAEPRAPGERFRFAVIGDAEPGRFWVWRKLFNRPGVFWRQLRAADAQPVDFIVQLGDMVSRGVARNFLRFFRGLSALAPRKPYLTVIGNHDRRSPHGVTDAKLYTRLFGKTDYFFDRGGWRFVVLDNSAQRVTAEQLRWLDRALDTPLRKVVFTHVPPATLSEWTDWGKLKGVGGFKQGADGFTRLVARRGVERVYLGHVHALDAREHRGATYVLTGGGGSPLYPTKAGEARHHWLVVEAGPDGLRETVHSLDGPPQPLRVRR